MKLKFYICLLLALIAHPIKGNAQYDDLDLRWACIGYFSSGDWFRAMHFCRLSAKTGDKEGQLRLGLMFLRGNGVDINYQKANKWIFKAAQQGLGLAQWEKGRSYELGRGVLVDEFAAYTWYYKAKWNGHRTATFSLDRMNRNRSIDEIMRIRGDVIQSIMNKK